MNALAFAPNASFTATTEFAPTTDVDRVEELRLLAAVLSGDRAASKTFVRRYNSVIESRVRRVLSRSRFGAGEDDVQDMVSEIWVSLWAEDMRPLRRFNPNRLIKVSTWIGLLARNKTIDKLRTTHDHTVSIDDVTLGREPSSMEPLASDQLESRERQVLARQALAHLSRDERKFMEAWYVNDVEPEQMAREFGIAVGTVYSRRFKIQAKLAKTVRRLSHLRDARQSHKLCA